MQVNIDTALVRDAIEKMAQKALAEITQPTSLGEMARTALRYTVQVSLDHAARTDELNPSTSNASNASKGA